MGAERTGCSTEGKRCDDQTTTQRHAQWSIHNVGTRATPACDSLLLMEAAFFDLDKTVIAKASMVAFGRDFYRDGLISRRTIMRAIYGHFVYQHLGASESQLDAAREKALALTKGWDKERGKKSVRETVRNVVDPISSSEAAALGV